MDNPAVGAYHFERYCPTCKVTTVWLVAMSQTENKAWLVVTTQCQVCKQGEGKAV